VFVSLNAFPTLEIPMSRNIKIITTMKSMYCRTNNTERVRAIPGYNECSFLPEVDNLEINKEPMINATKQLITVRRSIKKGSISIILMKNVVSITNDEKAI
jgi:hypothetical protein